MDALYANRYLKILKASPDLLRAAKDAGIPRNDPAAPALCWVMGPALSEFVRWVLTGALRQGVRRLYFLARDGWWMYRAAQLFCAEYALEIECRYLSCSRQSLRLPLMHQNLPEALDRICAYSPGLTPNRLLARAGLEPPERRLVLLDLGLSRRSGEPLTRAELVNLHAALNRCPPFLALARLHSRMALPGLTGYLRQEGLTDPVPDAVVDSGWTGTLQQSLSDACALIGRSEPVTGFYFGLYTLPRGARRETYHCYLFAPGSGLREKVRFGNNLFEAIMTAPHGTTTHYVQSEGGFLPVYAPMAPEQRERIEHFGDLMLRYVRAFLDTQSAADFLGADFAPRRRVIRRLMAQWMVRPTQAEAVCFGTLPFSDDVLPGAERDLAPPPGAGLLPRSEPWHAGSRARFSGQTGPTLRYTLYQYARHGRDLLRGGRGARP